MAAHLYLVHLPFALLLAGFALDAIGAALSDGMVRRTAGWLLIAGSLAALLAFATGPGALGRFGPATSAPVVESHTQWGSAGVWPIAIAGLLRLMWRARLSGSHGWANLALAALAAGLVTAITRSGLAIAHGG
jgi:uncharacterized membrane protein